MESEPKVLLVTSDATDATPLRAMLPGIRLEVVPSEGFSNDPYTQDVGGIDVVLVAPAAADCSRMAILGTVKARMPAAPIIVLGGSDANYPFAMRLGAHDYLVKAKLEGDSLLRAVRHAIERKCAEDALHEGEERYRRLVEISSDAILVHSEGKFVLVNEAAAKLFGASLAEQLLGKSILGFVQSKDRNKVLEPQPPTGGRVPPFVKRKLVRLDRSVFDAQVAATACSYRGKPAIQVVVHKVGERQQLESRLSFLAQYDLLTELPNRSQFRDRLSGAISLASRDKRLVGVMFVDLDHFNVVNQTLGQGAGDVTLQQVSQRLKQSARKSDTVARLGGDEFSLILEGLAEKDGAAVVAQRALQMISMPLVFDGVEIRVTASIGITVFPLDADGLDGLLRNADVAMYYAKERGHNNYQFYSPELDAQTHRDKLRAAEIAHRIANLTPREREVMGLLVSGKPNKMVAYLLGASTRTIENHRARIMDKMQAESLPELVRMGLDLRG